MSINYQVPFSSNLPDNMHCFQAAFKMVFDYFLPETKITFDELDELTSFTPGLYTWPMAGMLWLSDKGFSIINIEVFNYERFIAEGGSYLLEEFGDEVGTDQIKKSNIIKEQRNAEAFIKKIILQHRIPTIKDIKNLLDDGYLVICNVNANALYNEIGYSGHAVVIKGYDNNHLYLHDPGLPPTENLKVTNTQFMKSWAYPDKKSCNVAGFKYKK